MTPRVLLQPRRSISSYLPRNTVSPVPSSESSRVRRKRRGSSAKVAMREWRTAAYYFSKNGQVAGKGPRTLCMEYPRVAREPHRARRAQVALGSVLRPCILLTPRSSLCLYQFSVSADGYSLETRKPHRRLRPPVEEGTRRGGRRSARTRRDTDRVSRRGQRRRGGGICRPDRALEGFRPVSRYCMYRL